MFLIAGLGNPGRKYEKTKHNMGFCVVDELIDRHRIAYSGTAMKAMYGKGMIGGEKVILIKPMTYMNLSGEAVAPICNYFKVDSKSDLIVISDDVELDVGKLRVRPKGSAGGHNGLQNITDLLGTEDWARVRVGIGNDFSRGAQIGFVLGNLSESEKATIQEVSERIEEGIKILVTQGPERAMNYLNTAPKKEETSQKDEKSSI